MAKYMKREMADLNGTGRTQAYYRLFRWRNVGNDEFVAKCSRSGSGLTRGEVTAVLTMAAEVLAEELAQGYTVTIDGLGTFSAKLGVREDKEQDAFETDEQKRNAMTIGVSGVGFRADKSLVCSTDGHCRLERGGEQRLRRSPFTAQERASMARSYVGTNPFLRVKDYAAMTGLSLTVAGQELRQLCQQADSGIVACGAGNHRVYVRS